MTKRIDGTSEPSQGADCRQAHDKAQDKRWYKKTTAWVVAVIVAGLAAFITGGVTQLLSGGSQRLVEQIEGPVDVVARRVAGCPFSYVIPSTSPKEITAPPSTEFDPALRDKWAADFGGVDGGNTVVEFTVTGKSSRAVVLQDLKVEVISRNDPLRGTEVHAVCGDALQARYMTIDLDKKPPTIETAADYRFLSDPTIPEEPVSFPYKVSESDPEVFYVIAFTEQCDCMWRIKLSWVAGGESGERVIDNKGQPFRTTSIANADSY